MDVKELETIGYSVIGAAFNVRKALGGYLYEDIYEEAMSIELQGMGLTCERQVYVPVFYKNIELKKAFRLDLLVEGKVCVEIKAIPLMGDSEIGQLASYLRFGNFSLGYLINFHAPDFCIDSISDNHILRKGIYRFINTRENSNSI